MKTYLVKIEFEYKGAKGFLIGELETWSLSLMEIDMGNLYDICKNIIYNDCDFKLNGDSYSMTLSLKDIDYPKSEEYEKFIYDRFGAIDDYITSISFKEVN